MPWNSEEDDMRRPILAVVIVLRAAASAGQQPAAPAAPAPPQPASIQLAPELARVLTDYEAAWRVGDGAALARLFDENGFALPNGGPPVRGRAAIQRFYKGPGSPLVLRAFASATEGTLGYILGAFSRKAGEPDVGKFTLTLRKRTDGRWLILSDMDNGNRSLR
jgi:ketosteroid isomerase-like protein